MLVSCVTLQENFVTAALADNVECTTLKLKPTVWDNLNEALFVADWGRYCAARRIDYCLYRETGQGGNVHYHGIVAYPSDRVRKNLMSWFCRYWGRVHVSEKHDVAGWERYCTKDHPAARPLEPDEVRGLNRMYLFDDPPHG